MWAFKQNIPFKVDSFGTNLHGDTTLCSVSDLKSDQKFDLIKLSELFSGLLMCLLAWFSSQGKVIEGQHFNVLTQNTFLVLGSMVTYEVI